MSDLTPEQSAILHLLGKVEQLERRLNAIDASKIGGQWAKEKARPNE